MGYLAWTLGWVARGTHVTAHELLARYALEDIPRDGFTVDAVDGVI